MLQPAPAAQRAIKFMTTENVDTIISVKSQMCFEKSLLYWSKTQISDQKNINFK